MIYNKEMEAYVDSYRIHLEPEPEGGFTVTVRALPGCVTWGRDRDHAIEMAQECIEGFLEAMAKAGESIPGQRPELVDALSPPVFA